MRIETPLPPQHNHRLNEPQDSQQAQTIIRRGEPQNIDAYEEIKEYQAPPIVSIDQLRQQLQEDLESEGLDSIDDVKDLILEKYEQEKGSKRLMATKLAILKYQGLLDREIVIQTLMMKSHARQLRLDSDEEYSSEDLRDLSDSRKIIAERASKKGDMSRANKAAAEIAQYQILIEIQDEIVSLKKAKAGIQDPPVEPRILYPTLSLKKRFTLLSKLLALNNLVDYQELLSQDREIENSNDFQTLIKSLQLFIRAQKWEMLGLTLFNTFLKADANKHYAMKIYYMQEQQQRSVLSPILMKHVYEQLKSLKAVECCREIHMEIVESFTRFPLDFLQTQVDIAKGLDEGFGSELDRILKPVMPKPPEIVVPQPKMVDPVLEQTLQDFEIHFGMYQGFQIAQESLLNNDVRAFAQFIRQLMPEIKQNQKEQHKFCELFQQILKLVPDVEAEVSAENIYTKFAPIQLKNAVRELFKKLKREINVNQNVEEEQKDQILMIAKKNQKSILDIIQAIHFEDPKFSETLHIYFSSQKHYKDIVNPLYRQLKSLKDFQIHQQKKAYSQIEHDGIGIQRISDFMALDIDLECDSHRSDMAVWYFNQQKLNGKILTRVLFDMIKRKTRFDKFLALLSPVGQDNSREMPFTEQFLMSYLLNNSDTYLRTMILLTCSSYMPIPLVVNVLKSQNLIHLPNHRQVIECQPYVFEELFYCFEKHMAVLSFKVSANPNKSPQGCTSLTNYVFNRSFQTHSNSLVNNGSIDIQFDYNFESPMHVPVADAHGLVDEKILELVYPLFNIFIIHAFSGSDNLKIVQKRISQINQNNKNPLIFVITHDTETRRSDKSFSIKQDANIIEISFRQYSDLLDVQRKNLRQFMLSHFMSYIGDYKSHQENILTRLNSLQEFSDFISRFRNFSDQKGNGERFPNQTQQQVVQALDITRQFSKFVDENKDYLRSDKVLPMNVLFEEACRLEQSMIKDIFLSSEITVQCRLKIRKAYQEMKQSMPSPLAQNLKKIIDHKNYLGLTSIISKLLKSFLNYQMLPLYKEREALMTTIQKANQNIDAKDDILKMISEITKTLQMRQYSQEFLYREFYISELSKLRESDSLPGQQFTEYLQLAKLQLSQGQPFEIIDGDNLHFIKEIYQRIEPDRIQQEEILVVSVIGPQSSGKSLLLNKLFGTQFVSSAGRSTRGIYGCLIDIKCEIKQTHFQKILILDTQGFQSSETIDEVFDKKVVFYMLCVSHVVLICNKGEMNKSMEDTIKLAANCFMQESQKIEMQPQVNIIMNNVQINENSIKKTVKSLQNCFMEIISDEQIRQILTIDQSNVFLLPNAFAKSENEEFVAYQPSLQFAQQVNQIRKRIITFMQYSNKEDTASFTLESWFKYAQLFWEFTDCYSGLTDYSTLEEMKEDILLSEHTKKMIAENFEEVQMFAKHEKMIHDAVNQVLDQHQGFDQTNINVIKQKIDQVLLPKYQEVESHIKNSFFQFIDEKGIRPQIKRKRVLELDDMIRQNFLNWKQLIHKLLEEFNQKKSILNQEKSLKDAIDGQIQTNLAKASSTQLKALLGKYKERGQISQVIYDIMIKVDRKNFINDEGPNGPYEEQPRSIGWGTTISAPIIHASTLEALKNHLKPGTKCIDIGTGSGYMAACFAEMVGNDGKVYMVDHVQQIIEQAIGNIQKANQILLNEKRIIPILKDGRKGHADDAPYDVIHVGGALEKMPKEIIDQLAPGGIIWAPVGPRDQQQITLYQKNEQGKVLYQEIMSVRYGNLTSVDEQIGNNF